MQQPNEDIVKCRAMVIDNNVTSRTTTVALLREMGMQQVVQASRASDARKTLEVREFDIVLCEQSFDDNNYTGQELLDDLRRAQLLPFSTVFIMVTAEATYTQVAEAAESALDSYLLKPYTQAALEDRIVQARYRKKILSPIFKNIEAGNLDRAIELCIQRFTERDAYWLYAARIGAELLLQRNRPIEAQSLFEAIVAAKTLPWAKLGIARAQLDAEQPNQAMKTLEDLLSVTPNYADAYDVMGRIHVDQGNLRKALNVYQLACSITPSSIPRLQKRGMLAFYLGDKEEASKALDKAAALGMTSKMFDHQALMLLTFTRYQLKDQQGVKRCTEQIKVAIEKNESPPRLLRFLSIAQALYALMNRDPNIATQTIGQQSTTISEPIFDVESACNLLTLTCETALTQVSIANDVQWITMLGQRFCTTKNISELLAGAAIRHKPYMNLIQHTHQKITEVAQQAVTHAVKGNPKESVVQLIQYAKAYNNVKLMDLAQLMLDRHKLAIEDADQFQAVIRTLKSRWGDSSQTPALGQVQGRNSGGIVIRVSAAADATTENDGEEVVSDTPTNLENESI